MGFAGRLAACLGAGAACLGAVGCGFAQKPYANDPLLRGGRTVWLARDVTSPVPPPAPPLLEPPEHTIQQRNG